MFNNIYKNKTVLVTGHTGFKGSWLISWLRFLGANVTGIALDPTSSPSHFNAANLKEGIVDLRIDVRDEAKLRDAVLLAKPDFVFHLAAQALVSSSYKSPLQTWNTNVLGTLNLLDSLRGLSNKCNAVIITSDKCYDNVEWVWGYRESDALGGDDPYSASKGAAELAIKSHTKSFFNADCNVRIVSARAGNVIGGGDWSEDRIIPDCVRAWANNKAVELRNPAATRPWQHVLEPLGGYLVLGQALNDDERLHGESFNFGPLSSQNFSVLQLVEEMAIYWPQVKLQSTKRNEESAYNESNLLRLNCDKSQHLLGWRAAMDFSSTVQMTADWYMEYYKNPKNCLEVTKLQIEKYVSIAEREGLSWAKKY
jgi:CDP-glucose 4,6-dehydratase